MKAPKPDSSRPVDPFFGLKYIAYCRTGLPVNPEDVDEQALFNFAKWQICKVRNVLWNDPVWDSYTAQEVLAEYFAIKFDESSELRAEFERGMSGVKKSDLDWLEERAERHRKSQEAAAEDSTIKEVIAPAPPEEFEDKF